LDDAGAAILQAESEIQSFSGRVEAGSENHNETRVDGVFGLVVEGAQLIGKNS
jgi:hypothetical protein